MSTDENNRRILAQKIADVLFMGGMDKPADRLQLRFGRPVEAEIPGGGWCREAAIDQIERVLKENA